MKAKGFIIRTTSEGEIYGEAPNAVAILADGLRRFKLLALCLCLLQGALPGAWAGQQGPNTGGGSSPTTPSSSLDSSWGSGKPRARGWRVFGFWGCA